MAMREISILQFGKVYPLYVQKVERKGRTKAELDAVICWLTGYDAAGLRKQEATVNDFTTFFAQAPALNPRRMLVTGVVCGVRVEDIDDPVTQQVRQLDKLVDELAKGRPLAKVLREDVGNDTKPQRAPAKRPGRRA
ncbi:MAG TPA: DUF2200 domain-containing protein [Candidatus Thermoplasmatota archaeon]|nr:DUF2200 domain-containing protein [Candidatus Thermoplasmatota archaeon]